MIRKCRRPRSRACDELSRPREGWSLALAEVGAVAGVQAFVGDAEPLDRPSGDQMFRDDFRGIGGLHAAIPDCAWINHNNRAMLALVQAARLVDANLSRQPGFLGQFLQADMQIAGSVGGAGGPGRIRWPGIVANKNVAFEGRQAVLLWGSGSRRVLIGLYQSLRPFSVPEGRIGMRDKARLFVFLLKLSIRHG